MLPVFCSCWHVVRERQRDVNALSAGDACDIETEESIDRIQTLWPRRHIIRRDCSKIFDDASTAVEIDLAFACGRINRGS